MTDHEFIVMRPHEERRQHRPSAAGGRLGRTDRRSGMGEASLAVAGIALLCALLVGCGGKNDTPASGRDPGALRGTTASGVPASGTRLGDCEYANALVRSLNRFTAAVPPFGTASVEGKDGVIQALDAFDGELVALIGELRGYQLNADIARVNDGVARVFEDTRRQIPELRSAVESGDVARLTTAATTLNVEVFPRLDAIQSENKGAFDRLNKCGRALDRFDIGTRYA